ncbi:MAG: hypothetical protein JJ894_14415 [Dinoroseobacter sp.]|nr:hypothetical protein [Dinoroseobacter sp.]
MTRQEIEALLPFLANGTLDGEELREVEAAVAGDSVLAQELAALTAMREGMQSELAAGPGELGLARLMRDVEGQPPKVANLPEAPSSWSRVWQAAAVIVFFALAVQSFYLWQSDKSGYQLAGDEAVVSGPVLVVAFDPGATEADIRALLLDLELEIEGGPSALGLYRLAVFNPDALDAVRAALGAATIVESVTDE